MKRIIPHMIEWFEIYIRHKDMLTKKIETIDKHEDKLIVTYKDKTQVFYIFPDLADFNEEILKDVENPSIVMINSEGNLKHLMKIWNKLIKHPKLSIYSINPFSSGDTKWIIFPYTHHQISEESSLKTGLESMFNMVEPITIEEYMKKI